MKNGEAIANGDLAVSEKMTVSGRESFANHCVKKMAVSGKLKVARGQD